MSLVHCQAILSYGKLLLVPEEGHLLNLFELLQVVVNQEVLRLAAFIDHLIASVVVA